MDKLTEELAKRIKKTAWERYPIHNKDKDKRISFIYDLSAGATMCNTLTTPLLEERDKKNQELQDDIANLKASLKKEIEEGIKVREERARATGLLKPFIIQQYHEKEWIPSDNWQEKEEEYWAKYCEKHLKQDGICYKDRVTPCNCNGLCRND